MAGGAVASTVDEFLHGRQNQPVFLPTKKAAKAKKAAPLPLEAAVEPVGSLEVSLE
jgi:hypothetical protein